MIDPVGRVASIDEIIAGLSGPTAGPTLPGGPTEMAFRLEDNDIGNLELGCDTGFIVREYDMGFPRPKEVVQQIALDDGSIDVTRFLGPRAINLDVVIDPRGKTDPLGQPDTESKMRSRLLAYTHPRLRPWLVFREEGDARVRRVQLRGADGGLAVSQPRFNRLGVSWVGPLGIIESYEQRCVDLIAPGSPGQADCQNDGDVPSHWIAVIVGPMKDPKFQIGQDLLSLSIEIQAGQVMSLNSRTKTVFVDGNSSSYQYLDRYSTWFRIPPGFTTMLFEHSTPSGAPTAVQLCWNDSYML